MTDENAKLFAQLQALKEAEKERDLAKAATKALELTNEKQRKQIEYLRSQFTMDYPSQRSGGAAASGVDAEKEGIQRNLDAQTQRVVEQATLHGELQVVNVAVREENRALRDELERAEAELRILRSAHEEIPDLEKVRSVVGGRECA